MARASATGAALPSMGRIVHYRGKQGYQAWRPAIVTVDAANLDPRGVEAGVIPALDSDEHVHLKVFSAGEDFAEYNVPPGDGPGCWRWPPRVG